MVPDRRAVPAGLTRPAERHRSPVSRESPVSELVRVERDGGIATIRLDRPPMNALNAEIQQALGAACAEVSADREVAAVIVYGGDKVFAAGADIKEMASMSYARMSEHSVLLQDF